MENTFVRKTFLELKEDYPEVEGSRKRECSCDGRLETHYADEPVYEKVAYPVGGTCETCKLNPNAPEFDFTGVSGEPQYGADSHMYMPLPEYTVQEWFDYIYWLQANRVVLPPEYAAYVCEIARLLGVPLVDPLDPQTVQVQTTGRLGCYLVSWHVDARKLKSNDKQIISPGFFLCHPSTGEYMRMLLGLFPEDWSPFNSDANFKKADGRGYIQLKCDTTPKDQGCLPCRFGFSLGNGTGQSKAFRHGTCHFDDCSVAELSPPNALWDLPSAATRDYILTINCLVEM